MKLGVTICALGALLTAVGCGPAGNTNALKQKTIMTMSDATLEQLYKAAPDSKDQIKEAAGYGVFSTGNVHLFLLGVGSGWGVVTDNDGGGKTYMRQCYGGLGPGLAVKDYRIIVIFNRKKAMESFVESGWEFGGKADAIAKTSDSGGAATAEGYVGEGTKTYTLTESGLALQATLDLTKFWQYDELN